jgi:hypothetical protein
MGRPICFIILHSAAKTVVNFGRNGNKGSRLEFKLN